MTTINTKLFSTLLIYCKNIVSTRTPPNPNPLYVWGIVYAQAPPLNQVTTTTPWKTIIQEKAGR